MRRKMLTLMWLNLTRRIGRGSPLVDRFPDLGCDLAEPECGCCHCDLSDKLGPTTSEPDMVLYSDRTSDTVMSDCRYIKDRLVRDTGYNFWEVED